MDKIDWVFVGVMLVLLALLIVAAVVKEKSRIAYNADRVKFCRTLSTDKDKIECLAFVAMTK